MKLIKAQVINYRSVRDSTEFELEPSKTIFVGPNEAGKTAILRALQQINPPADVPKFDTLRDYPRASYNDITTKKVDPAKCNVVVATFALEDDDKKALHADFHDCTYTTWRRLDNSWSHRLDGGPQLKTYGGLKNDLIRLSSHMDDRVLVPAEGAAPEKKPTDLLNEFTASWQNDLVLRGEDSTKLNAWLNANLKYVDEDNEKETARFNKLQEACEIAGRRIETLKLLRERLPIFVLFSNYFRVRPIIHLDHLASRVEQNILDDVQYDYGNLCLLKLLGFTPRELSDLGKAKEPSAQDVDAMRAYRDQLDKRQYQLNAASVKLTEEIRSVWNPNPERAEADRLRIVADGQYLKVVVEDSLGVEIELDQRSEGFQWLVSFFVVFFAEAADKHQNAILLLDEPGLSLHGLKQRDFRDTISRLAKSNQTVYTTHSPFLVGPDELDLVRVVEMTDRRVGTKVHTEVMADDPASLLPLQEALGYDLAQSLFAQQRNLILEGLTDFWYLEATSDLLRDAGIADLDRNIALISANKASKVVYFATILHAHNLKVAALLDSDVAGDQAAKQEILIHKLGNKRILRTQDVYTGAAKAPEIEDLLRETLVEIAKAQLGWNVSTKATAQPNRPIVDIFSDEIADFSKYRLAKAYVRWTRENTASALKEAERKQWIDLISKINSALRPTSA
ncbi:OLD family endonuclease [Bradyrhizobium centrolobii]|uniref:OLD family endonuclease n=1 Tax=Bradyrhizobium centrolobii TaxID=1505087 RepID=A0A176YGV5_9BRAD|nr:AAA family ATPase [Bradyrhizobium centrolobii]OAF05872.1 OLD family endonuclease [Bradyrhizobium centrolobii]